MNEACEDHLRLLRDLENQLSGTSLGGLSFILLFLVSSNLQLGILFKGHTLSQNNVPGVLPAGFV